MKVAAAVAAVSLVTIAAHADERPLRVDYEAHEGCPAGDVFLSEVLARTNRARAAAADEPAREVQVRITRLGPKSAGRLVLWTSTHAREIEGDDCRDVVSALALITALAIDPEAARGRVGTPPSAPEPTAAPTSEPAPQPPQSPPETDPWQMPVGPLAPRSARAARGAGSPPPPASPPARPWIAGAQVSLAIMATPRPLVGGSLFIERGWGSAWWGASARIAVELAATGPFDAGPGRVSFLRGIGRLEGCPVLRPARWLGVAVCLDLEVGFLQGAGIPRGSIDSVDEAAVPWAALGLLPRMSVDAGDYAVVALQAGPVFPLVRRTFVFEHPDYSIHSLPQLTGAVILDGGVRF